MNQVVLPRASPSGADIPASSVRAYVVQHLDRMRLQMNGNDRQLHADPSERRRRQGSFRYALSSARRFVVQHEHPNTPTDSQTVRDTALVSQWSFVCLEFSSPVCPGTASTSPSLPPAWLDEGELARYLSGGQVLPRSAQKSVPPCRAEPGPSAVAWLSARQLDAGNDALRRE